MRSLIIGAALLVAGAVAVLVGVYPAGDALTLADRVWPVLLFVVAITVVAELAAVMLMTGARAAGPIGIVAFGWLMLKRIAVEQRALDAILRPN